jgi:hypothetical protein
MSIERSPRFPSDSLADAISRTQQLYNATGRSPVASEIAATALGYSGLNGASRTTLAALSGYGLIQREGDTHRVSELGLRLIRPLSERDKLAAARTASLKPTVFANIEKNHSDCGEPVLASILLHAGFTDDGARRAAKVYKENVAFLKSLEQAAGGKLDDQPTDSIPEKQPGILSDSPKDKQAAPPVTIQGKVLAQYQIPLGANHAQLTFTGEKLLPEDFDALGEYVELFKRQHMRAQAAVAEAKAAFASPVPEEPGDES